VNRSDLDLTNATPLPLSHLHSIKLNLGSISAPGLGRYVSSHAVSILGMLPTKNSLRYLDLSVEWQAGYVHHYSEQSRNSEWDKFYQVLHSPELQSVNVSFAVKICDTFPRTSQEVRKFKAGLLSKILGRGSRAGGEVVVYIEFDTTCDGTNLVTESKVGQKIRPVSSTGDPCISPHSFLRL
jgi:hypothetical protein